jgi:hypothetical protein
MAKTGWEKPAYKSPDDGPPTRKGQRSQPGIAHTAKDASRTFAGIAAAMADQWGPLLQAERIAA